ncbi:MAG: AsmA-like C-terminal region-containing protein [Alphaproteobacteria bacterium]|nr:AsmA-like C-terminal region-containing protein [Alphaproteobacteria bacterium]MDP7223554.1 AsmA-like C-terminal region-containing protein [Alphaproteobacteria bacterium]
MVLFFEDDKPKKQKSRLRRFIGGTLKIFFVLAFLFGLSLVVWGNLGGSSDWLKEVIEKQISSSTRTEAEIGEFNAVHFFPTIRVDIADVVLSSREDPEKVEGHVGTFKFATSFWRMFFSDFKVRELVLEDAYLSDFITRNGDVRIASARIEDPEGQPSTFKVDGTWNGHVLALSAGIAKKALSNGHAVYYAGDDIPLQFSLGEMRVTANAQQHDHGTTVSIQDISDADEVIPLTAEIELVNRFLGRDLDVVMNFGESKMHARLALDESEGKQGEIVFEKLSPADISILTGFAEKIGRYLPADEEAADKGGAIVYAEQNIFVDVIVEHLLMGGEPVGSMVLPLSITPDGYVIDQATGTLAEGKIRLSATLKPHGNKEESELDIRADISKMNYAKLQNMIHQSGEGKALADVKVKLGATGATYDALARNLDGYISLVAGQGQMPGRALDIWGGGLLNALLPSFDPSSEMSLNCVIANFDIENGVGVASPLFMDTKRITVIGEGDVDFVDRKLKITVEPKAKSTTFLDVAPAVNISGALSTPEISISSMSLIKKIGGLAVGMINPAFLAVSLTDLGVDDKHPCHEFIAPPADEQMATEDAGKQ